MSKLVFNNNNVTADKIYQAETITINEVTTDGGAYVGNDVNTGGGNFTGRDTHNTPPVTPASAMPDANETVFRQWLMQHFSTDDLKILCADVQAALAHANIALPLSLDIIGGDGLESRCHNLIAYLRQRGHFAVLQRVAHASRPNVEKPWGSHEP